MSAYQNESDAALVARFHSGDDAAADVLLRRYSDFVRFLAHRYYIVGGESEDLIQEGMIGLFRAICRYDESREMSFRNFAASCILSKLHSAIKTDTRKKNQPLNNSIPIDSSFDNNPVQNLVSVSGDPVEYVIGDEGFQELLRVLSALLSKFEARVLELYLDGRSYDEIAAITEKSRKSIDNAICRIRKKLAGHVTQQGITGE